jgi:hypothetical protein
MFSQEAAHVSALAVTPAAGAKGLRTLGGFLVRVGGRLDKIGVTLHAGQETRAGLLGQSWAGSSLHFWDEGVLIQPPDQGVCGRHGTEEQPD